MDQITLLRTMSPELAEDEDDSILQAYLDNAKEIILNKLYPFNDVSEMELPSRFQNLQLRITIGFLAKRGAEFETQHNENNVYRIYGANDVPKDLLNEIVSFGSAIK